MVELVAAGREWSQALYQVLMAAAMFEMSDLYRMKEFQDYQLAERAYRRALITARVTLRDEQVRSHLEALSQFSEALPKLVTMVSQSRAADKLKSGRPLADTEVLKKAHAEVDEYSGELEEMEELTRRRVVEVAPP